MKIYFLFNRHIINILLVFAFLYNACKEAPRKTNGFRSYLKNEHGMDIPQDLHYYFVIPPIGCKSCTSQTRAWLHADSLAMNVTCLDLGSDDRQGIAYTRGGSSYLMDDMLDIRQYRFDVGALTLIRTRNNDVDSVFQLNANNLYDIVKQENILRANQ